jgi:sterol O-acyltransferase
MFYKVKKYFKKNYKSRNFIQDWWNSTSFAAYYRTWNVVVHDWLYTYVYKEVFVVRNFPGKSKFCIRFLFLIA